MALLDGEYVFKEYLINCARYSDGLFFQALRCNFYNYSLQIDASLSKKYACQNNRAQLIRGSLNLYGIQYR